MWIDVHQHYLPGPPVLTDDDAWQAALYHESRVQGYADIAQTIAAMDAVGMHRCVWQGEYYLHHTDCVARNLRVAEAVAQSPLRLAAFASIQPNHPEALAELDRCRLAGFWGVGELNPIAQRFSLRGREFLRIAEYCTRWQLPMLMHVNEPVGPDYPGKVHVPFVALYELVQRFPELPLILAHWGGGIWWYEHIPAVQRAFRNVWYDSAASLHTYPNTALVVAQALAVVPSKILFGSDFPLKRPRQRHPSLHELVEAFTDTCTPEQLVACMGETAVQLFDRLRREPLPSPPLSPLLITLDTPVCALVEQYPAVMVVLGAWQVHFDDQTPWWTSVRSAASAAGILPEQWSQFLADIQVVTRYYAPHS
jgi:hypothetical protein